MKLQTMFTTSRTSGSIGWERVVSIYLHLCENILVDLRTHSGNLQVELSIISSSTEKNKVLYLVDGDTTSAAYLCDIGYDIRICTTVNDAIWRLRTGY